MATAGLQGPAADAALAVSIRERAGFATGEDGYGARDPPEGLLSTFSAAAVERLAHEQRTRAAAYFAALQSLPDMAPLPDAPEG